MKNFLYKKVAPIFLSAAIIAGLSFNVFAEDTDNENVQLSKSEKNHVPYSHEVVEYSEENEISIPAGDRLAERTDSEPGNGIAPMAAAYPYEYYGEFSDYISYPSDRKGIWGIEIYPGEVLQCQLDLPNSATLDYDLFLDECDAQGNSNNGYGEASVYRTYINGTSGTLPEAVGAYNNSNQTKYYNVFIESSVGSSTTLPFKLRVGISLCIDPFEADENIWRSITLPLNKSTGSVITQRAIDTRCDNDWYEVEVPSGMSFNTAIVDLDSTSKNAGYKVEVYTYTNGGLKKESNTISLNAGDLYFFRVTAENSPAVLGTNYTLTISPPAKANQIRLISISGFDQATYNGVTNYRINQNTTATISGQALNNNTPVASATVTVTIENTSVSTTSPNRYKTATVTTDSNGNFTAYVTTGTAMGANQAYLPGAINFIHYYDMGKFYAVSDNVRSTEYPVYLFAYSVRV